ncbi:acyltransferase family protein [Aerococcaceae bacterium WGS1372]
MHNYNINKIKFIAAIGVVLIHVFAFIDSAYNEPLIELQWPRAIFNYAVPLFFAITGYILSSKTDSHLMKYAGNIFRLYVSISLFYYVVSVLMAGLEAWLYQEEVIEAMLVIIRSKGWRTFVQGTVGSYHLWYLWASWLAILLFYQFRRMRLNAWQILILSSVIYLISLHFAEQAIWTDFLRYGGVPKALMYTALGYYIGSKGAVWKRNIIGLILWVAAYTITFGFIYQGKYLEILFIPVVYSIVAFLNRYRGHETIFSRWGEFSDQIYLLHALGINVYGLLMFVWPRVFLIDSLTIRVVLITLFAMLFSVLVYYPLNKYYLDPMNQLLKKISIKKSRPNIEMS